MGWMLLPKARNGFEDPPCLLGRVEDPPKRLGTGRGTLPKVWNWSGDPP